MCLSLLNVFIFEVECVLILVVLINNVSISNYKIHV